MLSVDSSPSSSTCNYGALSEDTKQVVHAFYSSNDITWQAPGRKDRVIIREINTEGAKVKRTEQVRYMLVSLREVLWLAKTLSCDMTEPYLQRGKVLIRYETLHFQQRKNPRNIRDVTSSNPCNSGMLHVIK